MQMYDLLQMFIIASPVTGNNTLTIKRKGKYRLNDTHIFISTSILCS